jgi:para-nitrobenzyl esterase
MKLRTLVGLATLAALAAAPAFAEPQQGAAPAASASALSVDKTPIGKLMENPQAKAVVLKEIPAIENYLGMISGQTLSQVATMSNGAIDDAKLKSIQDQLSQIK